MKFKSILQTYESSLALVIGNGVNLYGAARNTNSWHNLLVSLATEYLPQKLRTVPDGISLTEFYDILELKRRNSAAAKTLQQKFCYLMAEWKYYSHHQSIVNWAMSADVPILTTNFEQVLADAGDCVLHRNKKGGFTDYYPWESYYGNRKINDPAREFGIWHINGMQHYHRSVRLGLTHYMGSVERARRWLHRGEERKLFSGKNINRWEGMSSWLHIIFNCPLVIFGLALEENEVFFRWLLIERARYFKKFPERRKDAWYVYAGRQNGDGKQFFLDGVGIKPVHVSTYDEIYGEDIWN